MAGLIICGYPGVGKSACAGWNGCIDLESSTFSQEMGMLPWVSLYVKSAIQLAEQGFTVFVSTHRDVRKSLIGNSSKIPVVIFCPRLSWKEEWVERLKKRYEQTKLSKDQRALKHVQDFWDKSLEEMIDEAHEAKIPVIQPSAMDYDLKDYIYFIQRNYGTTDMHEAGVSPLHFLRHAIEVSDGDGAYFVGLRNGMRFAASLIDGRDPQYESVDDKGDSK